MRLIAGLLLLFLAACAGIAPANPEEAEKFRRQAGERAATDDFAGAVEAAAAAVSRNPADAGLHLQLGSLRERTGDLTGARDGYEAGLRRVPKGDPGRDELAWRLGLLYALKLHDYREARRLLSFLPPGSARHHDLLGALSLLTGDSLQAARHFESALPEAPRGDGAATVLYHLALARHRQGDREGALGDLYHASNHALDHGLVGDVQRLWTDLSAGSATQPARIRLIK